MQNRPHVVFFVVLIVVAALYIFNNEEGDMVGDQRNTFMFI